MQAQPAARVKCENARSSALPQEWKGGLVHDAFVGAQTADTDRQTVPAVGIATFHPRR